MIDVKTASLPGDRRRRRERQRRWRKSPRGKSKLRQKYQERVRFLDRVKSQAGCQVCHETDPRALGFYPRDPRKVKFLPVLTNISRSLKKWREVIKGCDVLCANCLAKTKKHIRKSVRASEIPKTPRLNSQKQIVNGISGPTPGHPTCKVCGAELRAKNDHERGRRRQFCGPSCRLIFWASRKLSEAQGGGG